MTTNAAGREHRKRHRRRIARHRRGDASGPRPDPVEAVEPEFDEAPIDDLLRQAERGAIDIRDL